eukprot:scaffold22696_cov118-Cylindrotheca_fusiformis.AAC.8
MKALTTVFQFGGTHNNDVASCCEGAAALDEALILEPSVSRRRRHNKRLFCMLIRQPADAARGNEEARFYRWWAGEFKRKPAR